MNSDIQIISALFSAVSAVFLGIQILNTIRSERRDRTFQMVAKLEHLMFDPQNSKLIKEICLLDDFSPKVDLVCAIEIYEKSYENRKCIYKILNYYELLSTAVLSKNIDEKILQSLSGYQILNAHIKLEPFIAIIRDRYVSQQSPPYQHFDALYRKWTKLKRFRNNGG